MKMINWKQRTLKTLGAGAVLAGVFYAGMAFAAVDPKLADADRTLDNTIALLQAAQNEGVKPPFGGHRAKAIWHAKQAKKEIAKAQKYAEKHQPGDDSKKDKKDRGHKRH
ncbi:MAG: hypothetical protein H6718_15865 [Polyangiaceae bacterium]|nr:hypothetical protein [Myxococcales bacterium]MCB9586875.1 hypothetical protein [Polyangiaceae bacterium]MCB9608163.1 hypothetical protein [Polyangiaceae bacterium]